MKPGVAFLLLLTACQQPPSGGTDIVASIGGDEVSYAAFENYLRENVDARDVALGAAVSSRLFDRFLDELLIVRLAVERGLAPDQAVDRRRAVAFLVSQAEPPEWSVDEIAEFYAAHRDEYRRAEGVRLRQILVPDRSRAEAARRALEAGEDFERVAQRFSQVPLYGLGGEDGRMTRDDLPPAFADSIFELEPGEVSEIFAAEYGFHIFQVERRLPAESSPLPEVEAEIRTRLERQRVDELMAQLVTEARARFRVRIHPSNFPFDYQGAYSHANNG